MSRPALRLALALIVCAQPAVAQSRLPRQWLYAAGGIAFGLGVTAIYNAGNYSKSLGWCSSAKCVGVFSTAAGGLVGYLIGHEVESKHRLRYRLAPPLDLPSRARMLRTRASGLELDRQLVAVVGDEGIELVSAEPRLDHLGHRARGLRDIADVGLRADAASLLVGTGTGLYLFSVTGQTEGVRALGGEVHAVAARGARVAVASGGVLQIGMVAGDSVTWRADSGAFAGRTTDLRWENDTLLWVLTESALTAVAVPSDSAPVALGSVELRGPARRLAVKAGAVAVAAGAEGVYLLRTTDPAMPRVVAHWAEPRYVYDVALWTDEGGTRVFAGAGPEGLYVLEPEGGQLKAVGLVSNVGFVAALAAGPDALYALDRTGGVLRRLDPHVPAAGH
ncbi:MAG: hypothetical protein HYS40_04880 [Gemmatimonadetes bacterium]|nr:hypothetical protein [Gemmatimonadota bacterium]